MSSFSPISWTDATWPIVAGCDYVSPGCSNCWAVRDSWRLAHNPNPKVHNAYFGTVDKQESGKLVWSDIVRPLYDRLKWPLTWRAERLIFVCSQADLFNRKVPFEFIAAAFGVMTMANWHTYQVLTKHPKRMREFFAWLDKQPGGALETCLWNARQIIGPCSYEPYPDCRPEWPLEHVWLGTTVEDQQRADERIPELLRCPAAVRWLSVEPMLEAIDLGLMGTAPKEWGYGHAAIYTLLHWIVCGGESVQTRANTRPFYLSWARALHAQSHAAGVAFFLKQLGTKPIVSGPPLFAVGKNSRYKWHEPEHWPADLRVQNFPTVPE